MMMRARAFVVTHVLFFDSISFICLDRYIYLYIVSFSTIIFFLSFRIRLTKFVQQVRNIQVSMGKLGEHDRSQ